VSGYAGYHRRKVSKKDGSSWLLLGCCSWD
jgi:hypothetical protein